VVSAGLVRENDGDDEGDHEGDNNGDQAGDETGDTTAKATNASAPDINNGQDAVDAPSDPDSAPSKAGDEDNQ
jgi:hypothetical protein